MSFFKGLFKKKSQNKTQQNIPSQTNQTIQDETEDNFIKHSPNGEKLKNLWEKRKQITDPEARTNWFFEFSNLFIESYKDWSPEDIIQNQNKNLIDSNLNINENEQNKTKKKDKKNKKNSEKELHLTLQNAINNDLAHPTELITETMNGLLTFKELLDSHLEKESGINLFESKQSDILSANSLDMVDILIKSQFNRNSFENLFLFNLLVELANVANSYFKIFIADTKFEKTNENLEIYQLSPSQTKHQLLLQFLLHKVLKITCVLSNLNFINDLNTSLEKQLFSINSELKLQWIVNFGLLDYLIAFLDNSYHLSENFLLNHHQYQIQINLFSILLHLSISVPISDDISMRITDTILNILTRPNLSVPKIQLFNFENVKIEKVSEKQKLNIYLKSFDSIFNNIKNAVIHENIFTFNQTFQISTLKNLEFQTKIIVLQTLRELIKENTKIETSFGKNSQFSRLCDLILWVAYSFPQDYVEEFTKNKQQQIQKKIEDMKAKEKEKTLLKIKDKQNTKTNQRSNSLNNSSFLRKNFIFPTNLQAFQTDLPQILQLSNPDDFSQPKNTTKPKFPHDIQTNHKLHRLFQVFRDICIESANNSLLIKEDNKNTNQKTIKENIGKKDLIQSDSNWENLQRWKSGLQSISRIKDQILCVCLDTFNYNFHKSYANREYRDFIRIISPDLQLEVFMLFSTILDQAALDILNEYNMWNIFCSDFFYYETNNYFIGPKPSLDLFHSLKGFMFDLISYVATNQIVSNIYECQILIKLIKDNAKNLNIVLECIKTLLSIMKNKLLITQESLQKLAAIDELCVLNFELQEEQIYLQLQKRKSNQNLSVDQEYIDNLKENHQNYLKRTKTFSSDLIYEIRFHIYDIINLFFSNPKIINKFIRNNKNSEFASIKILLNNLLEVKTRRFIMKQFQNIFVSTPKTKNHSWIDFYMLIIEFISRMHQTFINSYQEQTNKNIRYLILIRDFLQTLTLSIIQNQRALQSILVKVGIFKLTATLLSTQESSNKLIIDILRLLIQIFRANRKNIIYFNKDVGYKTLENLIAQSNYLEKADTIYNLLMNMVVNNNVFNKENDNKFKKDFNDNTFDQETNFIIQNPDVVPVLFRLYSQPNTEKLFLHLLETFIDICNKSIHNTSCCCDSGLISLLIDQIPILFIKKHLLPKISSNNQYKAKREKEIQKSNQTLIERVIGLLAILGSHYISVNELNLLFSHLKKFKSGAYSPYSHLFLLVLKKILSKRHAERRRQPKVFFDFDGRSSCLVFPKLEKWPLVHGYTFSTWMRIESFIDPLNKPNYEPRIFSFLTQNGQGIEAFFALRSKYSDKKDNKNIDSSEQKVMHLVEPKMDFVIKVTTNQSESDFLMVFIRRNKDIYIDGAQVFKSSLKYPSTTDHLIYNKIGSNFQINQSENQKQSTRENPFFGQMGTIYIFDDVLNANQISGIYQLGANYMWSFEEQSINPSLYPKLFEAQNQQSQTSKHKTVSFSSPVFSLFDGSLTDKLFVNFNSKACDFKYCFDQNPNPVIQKTKIVAMFKCVIRNLDDIIYCLGGIKLLFPLFFELSHKEMQFDFETLIKELEQRISSFNIREYFHKLQNQNEQNTKSIKNPNSYPFSEDPNTSNKIIDFITSKSENNFNENIFDLIADVLIGSPANQEDMISSSGFLILGNILEGLPPDYINEKFIKTIQTIILKSAKPELIEYLTHTFIFNFDIWIYTDYQIQNQIIQEIMDNLLIKKETIFFNRSKIHTQQIMNLLRLYYWLSPETYSIGIEPKKDNVSKNSNISWNRPKNEEVVNLRNNLLNLLKNKFQNHVGVEDIQSIIQYCIAMYDIMHTEEMKDVIIFFHDLIQNSENLMCKKVLERKKEANKLEKEQKRKTIIDTTKVKAKEGENDNQAKSSKKSKEEKNRFVFHDELHKIDSSKVIEALSSIGYMDAFIVFLDIEDDSLRELFLHIIWHIDFFNENIQNKKKYTSRLYPESGYYIIHSILLKYKFTKKISQILFQMLLSTNHNFEEIIENNEEIKIQKPWILETIFQFIIKEPEHFYSLEIMQEILYLLKKSDYNCSVFIQQQMWQNWLIEMVDQNSLIENEENENQNSKKVRNRLLSPRMTTQKHKSKWKERRRLNKIKEEHIDVLQKKQITRKEIRKEINQTVFETFKILQEYCFMKEKNGAKHLQQTLIYLQIFPFKKIEDEERITRKLFNKLVEALEEWIDKLNSNKTFTISKSNFKEFGILYENLYILISSIYQFIFFTPKIIPRRKHQVNQAVQENKTQENVQQKKHSQKEINKQFTANYLLRFSSANAKNEIDQTNRLSKKLGNYNAEELKSMFLQHREYGDVMFRFQSRVETEINKWEDYDLSSKFINFLQKLGVFENENYFLFLNDKTKTKNVLQITIIIMMELIKTGNAIQSKEVLDLLFSYLSVLIQSKSGNVSLYKREIVCLSLSHLFSMIESHQKENHLKVKKGNDKIEFIVMSLHKIFNSLSYVKGILDNENTTENTKQENKSLVLIGTNANDIMDTLNKPEWIKMINEVFHPESKKMKNDQEIYCHLYAQDIIQKMSDLDHENYEKLFEKLGSEKIKSIRKEIFIRWFSSKVKEENQRIVRFISLKEKMKNKASRKWRLAYQNLTNERGPWGSLDLNANSDSQTKKELHWKLDKREDSSHRRRKFKPNYNFDDHFEASIRRDQGSKEIADKIIDEMNEKMKQQLLNQQKKEGINIIADFNQNFAHETQDESENDEMENRDGENENNLEEFEGIEIVSSQNKSGDLTNLQTISDGNSNIKSNFSKKAISIRIKCQIITPLVSTPGYFEITPDSISFIQDQDAIDVIKSKTVNKYNSNKDADIFEKNRSWKLKQIREMHKRIYHFRQSAIEIFFMNRTSFFFNFDKKIRNQIYNKIISMKPENLRNLESKTQKSLLRKSQITKKWQKRQITNFDYLMELNIIAGRSYNDISQYPVFPWIISNYESEELDLKDEKNYRDLSKPMGALNEERLQEFIQRYENFQDPDNVIPPFHYGSHYSSIAIVLFYLIRVEPFTTLAINLQGGKFDHADRIFIDVANTWKNCLTNSSDVKELIPEFFYFPEFLQNLNKFDLGKRQSGKVISDVGLPKWAKTAEEFIQMNRRALESEYVSQHLNEWIDLIFGFKQRGKEAVKSHNVFYYLTYENAVNIDLITDENERASIEQQIEYFGQTPSQLFTKPHPKRFSLEESNGLPIFWDFTNKSNMKAYFVQASKSPILYINSNSNSKIFVLDSSRYLSIYQLNTSSNIAGYLNISNKKALSNNNQSIEPTFALNDITTKTVDEIQFEEKFNSIFQNNKNISPLHSKEAILFEQETQSKMNRKKIGVSFATELTRFSNCFEICQNEKIFLSCGYWDNSFKLSNTENAKLIQSINHHKDIVTCLAIDGDILVTGSRDTTVAVWKLNLKEGKVDEKPTKILYGHDDEVSCIALSCELDIVVSGSKDGSCIIHNLSSGIYYKSIFLSQDLSFKIPVSMLKLSTEGHILVFSENDRTLRLFSVNGNLICLKSISENIIDWRLTQNSQYLIIGSERGIIDVLELVNFNLVQSYEFNQTVKSLCLVNEDRSILSGFENGYLLFGIWQF